MSIVFVEYQILPGYRSNYSDWMMEVRAQYDNLELYEGSDQPGLFVEIWNGLSKEQYIQLKQARGKQGLKEDETALNNNPFGNTEWYRLDEWIKGGSEKVHIWHFEKVK